MASDTVSVLKCHILDPQKQMRHILILIKMLSRGTADQEAHLQ